MSLIVETTPLMVSYLDLYGVVGGEKTVDKEVEQYTSALKAPLFGLPELDRDTIDRTLYRMGMDTAEDVEEVECNHRPNCLSSKSLESSPIVFGRAYCGYERQDKEWLAFKAKYL